MAKTVDVFLDDEQVQRTLTDILSRIDTVIADTQRMLREEVPL